MGQGFLAYFNRENWPNCADGGKPYSRIMWRQAADLQEVGRASGSDFWARVKALGERPYYPPPEIPGFPQGLDA